MGTVTPVYIPKDIHPGAWGEALEAAYAKACEALPTAGDRLVHAYDLIATGGVHHAGQFGAEDYTVTSQKDPSAPPYRVHAEKPRTCTCEDFTHHVKDRGYACKHIYAVWIYKRAMEAITPEAQTPLSEPSPRGGGSMSGLRPIQAIVADLSRPLPAACLATKTLKGTKITYLHWQTVARILDAYAPGWQGMVRRVDTIGSACVITYRLSIPCAEGLVVREATGQEEEEVEGYGDSSSNAEAMAFKRAAAKFGVGLWLYDKDNTGEALQKHLASQGVR